VKKKKKTRVCKEGKGRIKGAVFHSPGKAVFRVS
jgi:hypothetical protein